VKVAICSDFHRIFCGFEIDAFLPFGFLFCGILISLWFHVLWEARIDAFLLIQSFAMDIRNHFLEIKKFKI
jgi:hypothetical protein